MDLQINRVRLPARLFSVSLYRFFFLFGLCFLTLFFFLACFPLFLLSLEFYFGKGISRALDLRAGQSDGQKLKQKLPKHVPPLKQLNVFNVS